MRPLTTLWTRHSLFTYYCILRNLTGAGMESGLLCCKAPVPAAKARVANVLSSLCLAVCCRPVIS